MKYVSFIVFLLCVALSQERKLEKQNTDYQKILERRDYEHLSGSMEDEGEDSKGVDIDSAEENSLEDENEENGFQENLYNILLRMVSKDSISEPVEVDSMGVKYVNTTSEMLKNHGGSQRSFNEGQKFTEDHIPAIQHLYKSLDPVLKVEQSQNIGVAVGRLETAALESNTTETSTINRTEPDSSTAGTVEVSGTTKSLSESSLLFEATNETTNEATTEATVEVGTNNSTLVGDKPQARFGCLVSNLCTFCQQYAILPDNTHVCCLFCSIHPTLIPSNQGGFICSCDYFG